MLKKTIAFFASLALLLILLPAPSQADTIGVSMTYLSIDGKQYPMNLPAKGEGWSYNGDKSNSLILNNYNGGPIQLIRGTSGDYGAKQLRIETVNGTTNTVNGNGNEAAIGVQGTLRLNLGYGSTLNVTGNVTKAGIIAIGDKRYGNEMIDMETFNRLDLMDEEHKANAMEQGLGQFENSANLNVNVTGKNIVAMAAGQRIFMRSHITVNLTTNSSDEQSENMIFDAPQIEIKHKSGESNYTVNGTYGMIFGPNVTNPDVKNYHTGNIIIKAPSVFGTKASKAKWQALFGNGSKHADGDVHNAPASFTIVDGMGTTNLLEDENPYLGLSGGTSPQPATPDPAPTPTPQPNPQPGSQPQQSQKLVLTMNTLQAQLNNTPLNIDAAPFVQGGRTMVPLRLVGEAFGCTVNWFGKEQKIEVKAPGKTLYFFIGQNIYIEKDATNGQTTRKTIDSAPFIQKRTDRTFVPVRFVATALGYNASYTQNDKGLTENVIFER